ncbi:MAG: phosphatase PAP2 family protein [Ginsengibacter sp.]
MEDLYKRKKERSLVNSILMMCAISAGYLLLSYLLIGFRPEQIILLVLINSLYFSSAKTRELLIVLLPFIIFWIVFDYMKAFPNYSYNTVHIESLYDSEKKLFGFYDLGKIVTPNEYFLAHSKRFLDVLTGFFYLSWVPVPLAFTIYLFFAKRQEALNFSITFLLVNLLGFTIYYVYPAAPPWYVEFHGFHFNALTPGNPAGLIRFDHAMNWKLFESMYKESSNVFAAMPSLHSAYPLILFYFGLKNKMGKINILFGLLMVGIWFAAVYNSHHYILDVIAGIGCALLGIAIYRVINKNNKLFKITTGKSV